MNQIIQKFKNREFLVFCIIGVINTLSAQVLYMLFVSKNLFDPKNASLIADGLTLVLSYVLNMKYTYKEKMTLKSALGFPWGYVPGILLNALIVIFVVDILHLPKIIAKAVSLPITIPLNFILVSLIVKLTKKS